MLNTYLKYMYIFVVCMKGKEKERACVKYIYTYTYTYTYSLSRQLLISTLAQRTDPLRCSDSVGFKH